jgi:hypothetical protein
VPGHQVVDGGSFRQLTVAVRLRRTQRVVLWAPRRASAVHWLDRLGWLTAVLKHHGSVNFPATPRSKFGDCAAIAR